MILLSGYYGYGNWGDEAILASLCQQLEVLGWSRQDMVVLSGNPSQTKAYHKTKAVGRYDITAITRLLRRRTPVISGGGSLLQDTTSWRTIPYYLGLLEFARLCGCPTVMYAQGVGPIRRRRFQAWSVRAFRGAAACSVRDSASGDSLVQWGLPAGTALVTADPVYSLVPLQTSQRNRQRLLINLRPLPRDRVDLHGWGANLDRWHHEGWQIGLLPLGPGDSELLRVLTDHRPWLRWEEGADVQELLGIFASYDVMVSMRLHGMIMAAVAGCLPVGVAYDPKVKAAAEQLGSSWVEPANITDLRPVVAQLWQRRCDQGAQLDARVAKLRVKAEQNRNVLEALERTRR